MAATVSRLEETVSNNRHARASTASTVPAVDPNEFWRRLALRAIDGGYFKGVDDFVRFIEACIRFLSFEQAMQKRAYAHGIRNLADALARQWAGGSAPNGAPTADEIAGLLQSDWITSGEFKLLQSEAGGHRTA